MQLKFLRKLSRFWRRKKEEVVEVKPEIEKVSKREFPGISVAEQKKHIGKHIAVVGGKIVASAGTAKRALAMAKRKHSGEEIALRYVGSERLLINCKCLEES